MHAASLAMGPRSDDPDRVRILRLRAVLVAAAVVASTSSATAASALAAIAPEIARELGVVPAHAVVVVSSLTSDVPASRGDELAVRLASLVAGQLGPTTEAHARSESFSVARALAAKGSALVYVQAEIARGQLRASADLYPVLSNGWDRVRLPVPTPHAHAFASAPLDAEVRGYLPAIQLEHAHVQKARHDFGDVLAVACGDLEGDGGNDIVLVTRATIAWGRLASGRFVATHAVAWSALAPRVPVPLREPIATSAILPRSDGTGSDLFAGTTDRGGLSLSRDLRGAAPLHGLPFLAGRAVACVRPNAAAGALEGDLVDCADYRRVLAGSPATRYDSLSITELVGKDGKSRLLVAAREPSGALRLRIGEKEERLGIVGAQVAVGDLDEDGVAEVATSMESGSGIPGGSPATPDGIAIASWRGNELVPRVRIPAPAPVRALAICPPDDGGPIPLVAVVAGEVWVVR